MLKINWKKTDKIGGFFFVSIVFIIILFFAIRQTLYLWFYPRYTISEAVRTYYDAHMIKVLVYKFEVNGRPFEKQENYQGGIMGNRYYVKFSTRDPNVSDFLENRPVPDSIKNAPPNGWAKIPGDP